MAFCARNALSVDFLGVYSFEEIGFLVEVCVSDSGWNIELELMESSL